MILQPILKSQVSSWQAALANAITDPAELLRELNLSPTLLAEVEKARRLFPLRVPRGFVTRMRKEDPMDPLLRQVLPMGEELIVTPGYTLDSLNEKTTNPLPGLLHKYQGRVLLTVTGACAVNCRYCFRRHFPYEENAPGQMGWDKVIAYIQSDASISEVIYSGGDPFLAKDTQLAELTLKIAKIPHVKRLRIHTRLPIVIPERVTEELITWLTQTQLQPVIVLHCNHANEIDEHVIQAMHKLRAANITLLNQAVLLKGVNDEVQALKELSEKLFMAGILPYYLHVLDKVQGTAHFAIADVEAQQLIKDLMKVLSGYLVPKLVREVPGEASKRLL